MKYIGIDVGGTNLKAGLVDESGLILATHSIKMGQVEDADSLAWTLVALTQDLCRSASVSLDQVASVGVGIPGTVEVRTGTVLYTCNLSMKSVPLRKLFHRYLATPFYLENDANCAALAEYFVGAGQGSKRFIIVTLGTGIGGGIIHNGKIFHGANGMAGEVGHMSIVYGGEPCPCGRRGCWERYASANALKRMTEQAVREHPDTGLGKVVAENGGHVSGRSAFEAMRRGDALGRAVCERYIDYLAAGIINLVNIFQPDTLAIGGGVSNEDDACLLQPLRRRVERESIPCSRDKMTKIVKAELGNRAGIIGAAFLGKNKRV